MREGPRESPAQPLRAWKGCRKMRGIPASPGSGRCCVLEVAEGCANERTSCNNAFASFCAAEATVPTSNHLASTLPGKPEGIPW